MSLKIKDFSQLFSHSILSFFMRGLGAISYLAFSLVSVRQLGAEQAGYFFICVSIATFLSAFARLGFENTVLRFTSAVCSSGKTIKNILNYSLKYPLIFSIFISFILFLLTPSIASFVFKSSDITSTLRNITPVVIGFTITFIVAMSLQARLRIVSSVPCQGFTHILIYSCCILCFDINTAANAALIFSCCVFISAVYYYCISIMGLNNVGGNIDSREMWLSSRPNWFASISSNMIQVGGIIIIGIYLSAEDASYFSAAHRLSMLSSFFLLAVNLVVSSKFAKYNASGDSLNLKRTAFIAIRLTLIFGVPLVVLLFSFAGLFMGFFGEDFVSSSTLLRILLLGQIVNLVSGSVGHLLMMTGNEKYMQYATIVTCIAFLAFLPVATSKLGAIGAAIVTSSSLVVQNLLCVYFVKKQLNFNTLRFWQKI